jgi:hypothetical protein
MACFNSEILKLCIRFRHLVGLLGRVINTTQDFYLHRAALWLGHTSVSSAIRIHDPSVPAIKLHSLTGPRGHVFG